MSKRAAKKISISAAVLAAIVLTAGWLFGWFSPNPAIGEVKQLQSQLADPNLKPDARMALFQQIRTKMDSLSESARQRIWEDGRQEFQKRMEQHVDDLMAMAPADRTKALDADIDRMEKMRAQMQDFAKNNPNAGGPPGGAPGGGPPPWMGGRGTTPTDEQRLQRMKNGLNFATPGMRGKMNAYMELMAARMKERGISPPAGGGFMRGR